MGLGFCFPPELVEGNPEFIEGPPFLKLRA